MERAAAAIWFPQARAVEQREERLPAPAAGEIRVRALASGISHGTEMLVYRGQVPADLPLDLPSLQGGFAFPIKYGYASAGRVEEAGAGVEGLHEGNSVFVFHPHQTAYVVPATLAVPLPSGLPVEIGVFTANLETAVNVILDAHPRLGERVAVFGQGVVGLLLTQLLRRTGAGMIVAVDPIPLRRQLAVRLGADLALAADAHLPERLREVSEGGLDLAIEASGNPAALDAAIASVAFQGTVVVSSWYGTKPATVALGGAFHRGRVRILSSQVGSIDPALEPRWTRARRMELVRALLPQLVLEPLITQRIPFQQAAEAYALVDEHADETVQVVLTYGENDV